MHIDFSSLGFTFSKKPLLIGGRAMEYYGMRKSGKDIDFVVPWEDLQKLLLLFPKNAKNLYGDLGVSVQGFEIWKTIRFMSYEELLEGAIEEENVCIISLEKLLLQKALAMDIEKYRKDLELIVTKYTQNLSERLQQIQDENDRIVASVKNIEYVERKP